MTDSRDDLNRAVRRLHSHGHESLFAGVQAAAQHLHDMANSHLAVVLFTTARSPKESNLEDAIAALRGPVNVQFNAIAGPGTGWQLQEQLQRLAVKTGGFAFFPHKSGDMARVADAAAHQVGDPNAVAGTITTAEDRSTGEKGRRNYTAIIVRRVPVADNPDTSEFQSGDDELLQKMLIAQLEHEKLFRYVLDGSSAAAREATASPDGGRTLELRAAIVEYRRGNRAQRQTMGWMGGAKLKVNVELRDLTSGRPVQAFTTQGSATSGLFGGSNEEVQAKALKNVVEKIVSEVKKTQRSK
jgi:hypothetical protein